MIIGKTRTNQPVEDEGKVAGIVEDLVEGGTLDNAKPIYFHPIRFNLTGSSGGQTFKVVFGSIMILNNSNVALDTSEKLRAYLYNAGQNIDIIANVDFYDSDGVYQGQILSITAGEGNLIVSYTKNGATYTQAYFASSELVVIGDTPNKLN
jgi:hypothetical protein